METRSRICKAWNGHDAHKFVSYNQSIAMIRGATIQVCYDGHVAHEFCGPHCLLMEEMGFCLALANGANAAASHECLRSDGATTARLERLRTTHQ
jgi:hypothetical protein